MAQGGWVVPPCGRSSQDVLVTLGLVLRRIAEQIIETSAVGATG